MRPIAGSEVDCRERFVRIFCFLAFLLFTGTSSAAALTVYDGQFRSGFADYYSWASTYNFATTSPVHGSDSHSISFKPDNWGGIRMRSGGTTPALTVYPFTSYSSLTFWVHGGSASGQKIDIDIQLLDSANPTVVTADYGSLDVGAHTSGGSITAATWKLVTIDFDSANFTYGNFNTLQFQANSSSNATQAQVYFGTIVFNPRSTPIGSGAAVNVSVDTSVVGNAIDPRIFGVAYGDAARNAQIGYTVRRWGGNSTTRYNWQVDVHNTANDYYFENIPDSSDRSTVPPAGNTADTFIQEAIGGGSQPLITIPTIGWTPRADSALEHPYTVGFSVAKYGAQESIDSHDPNAGNGNHTNGSAVKGNDPTDSSTAITPSFEQAWIAHLQSAFGTAANGGVKLYSLDNEVMLWNSTHRDVHPAAPTEAEIWGKAQNYGTAIKQQDPNALVTGPVTWGYCDLFWSAADDCGASNVDRNSHGGLPFVAWYLQQNAANPMGNGQRIVDFLDLHYYPPGQNVNLSDDDSPATAARRLRALKELYNSAWESESWVADLGNDDSNHYSIPDLIPRAKAWINQYSPGTKLAITEYNWGNDDTTSGAVAQAEVFAIFAREGVDMATRWVAPIPHTVVENAFSIFLDYDGAGGKVLGNSVSATSSSVDQVGAYAFRIAGQRTMVLLTNKDLLSHAVSLSLSSAYSGTWKLYGFSGSSPLAQTGSGSIDGTTLTVSALPPVSASLLVIPETAAAYEPLVPARLLDTRIGQSTIDNQFAALGAVPSSGSIDLKVLGRGGVPAAGVIAVVVNVTATNPVAPGYVTVWPTGSAVPNASNLNFAAAQTIPNLVVARVGTNGKISLLDGSTGNVDLIADVVGYFGSASALHPLTPARMLDTRAGSVTADGQFAGNGAISSGGRLDLKLAGRSGLPATGVGAVILNVTATNPTASAGYITAWPSDQAQSPTSSLNFVQNQTIPNLVISRVSADGRVSLFNSAGNTDLIADILGWFPTTSELTALQPARLLDTRPGASTSDGQFAGSNALASGGSLNLTVIGRGGVPPSGVGAVILNVTVTDPTAPGNLRAWPTGSPLPNASSLNFVAGQTIPNLVIAKVGSGGQVSFYNGGSGTTQVIADVVGWFPAAQ
jgi:Glycoside hydrolase family 44